MAHGWIKTRFREKLFSFLFFFVYLSLWFYLAPTHERVGLLHILLFYFFIFLSSCDPLTLDEIGRIKKLENNLLRFLLFLFWLFGFYGCKELF